MSAAEEVLVLRRGDVRSLLDLEQCITAVEAGFLQAGEGKAPAPAALGYPAAEGGFHVKAASLELSRSYFAAKVNGNFPGNPESRGLPAINGVVLLFDAECGTPLAVLDSIEITILRTAAATAAAARHLARPDSRRATVCGCGNQGRAQLRALCRILPIGAAFAWDADRGRAEAFAAELAAELGIEITPVAEPGLAARVSDVIVTCTPARSPYLLREDVPAGAFVAAVGADAPEKRELCPGFLGLARVFVDSLEQCAAMGELHHALREGTLRREDVAGELAPVVAGNRPGRRAPDEVTVFDSTGIALEDVAAAAAVYEKAMRQGAGLRVALSG